MCSGILNSLQSVIWLMTITRIMGIDEAGIFTISYAISNLMLTLGKFGMRNFQVSDTQNIYKFSEYIVSRIFTITFMIISSAIYVGLMYIFQEYTIYKVQVVFFMCLLKSLDAIEDIFYGMYQQKGRLDLAGKIMSIRLFLTILCFMMIVLISRNLVITLIQTILISTIVLFIGIKVTLDDFINVDKSVLNIGFNKVFLLLKECIPLCVYSFLSFFLCNISKYMIDVFLGEEEQAIFGFISMPVFVISLLGNIIFQPSLLKLSVTWRDSDKKVFFMIVVKKIVVITSFSCGVILVADLFGIQMLEILYSTSLISYKVDFIILMFGGIFLSLSTFLCMVLTIMRLQNYIMYCYLGISIIASMVTPVLIKMFELRGASVVYLLIEALITIVFMMRLLRKIKEQRLL